MATQTNKSSNTTGSMGGSTGGNTGGKGSESSSGRVSGALDSVKSAGKSVSANPVGALVGGFAVGAVLGALIPATRRERDALQPVGLKINEAARGAARQAAEAGRDKLNRVTGEVVTQVGAKMVDAVAPPAA
jgi:hypothetical protein